MIDLDKWQEIFNSIRRHPLRTILTALGVFWGIFMLVILLGAGRGLQNGVEYEFRDDATNSVWVRRGVTSMPYQGLPKGRRIRFTNEDYGLLDQYFDEIDHLTGRYYLSGDQTISYGRTALSYPVRAVHPGRQEMPFDGGVVVQPVGHALVDGEEVADLPVERILLQIPLPLQPQP